MAVNYFGAMGLAKGLLAARAKPPAGAAAEIEKSSLLERPTEACVSVTGSKVTSGIDFVVINSVQGKFGVPFRSSYAASKHALLGFFDCLRAEETHRGVRVTSVFPGYIRTRSGKSTVEHLFFRYCLPPLFVVLFGILNPPFPRALSFPPLLSYPILYHCRVPSKNCVYRTTEFDVVSVRKALR